jgi:hypothetical protein
VLASDDYLPSRINHFQICQIIVPPREGHFGRPHDVSPAASVSSHKISADLATHGIRISHVGVLKVLAREG